MPRLLVIADAATAGGRLTEIVGAAVDYGARGFVLRARELPEAAQPELATALRGLLAPVDGLLIVAGEADVVHAEAVDAEAVHAGAVHLAATQAFPKCRPALVGRSCHNAAEVDRACAEGCDYVFVSPVYPTSSKPGYGPALGSAGLAELAGLAGQLRTYALGGVMPANVAECLAAGAYGVAVMGPVMRDPSVVATYLKELDR